MHPILFHWGPITLRWYCLFIVIGFLSAHWLFKKRAARLGLHENETSNLMLLLLLSGIVGARIYYVIWNWNVRFGDQPSFAESPIEILMIHKGGLVFFGGLFMATLALYFWVRWKNYAFAALADALSPPLALGHAFGRLGCFMNGCCHGRECNYFWAVRPESPPDWAGKSVHPTQLYEFLGLLDIVITLLIIEKIANYPGKVALSYCILCSLLRFVVEFFRGDGPHQIFGRFTLAQIVCLGFFFIAWLISARLSYRAAKARGKRIIQEKR